VARAGCRVKVVPDDDLPSLGRIAFDVVRVSILSEEGK
jgi:hypothetical protein